MDGHGRMVTNILFQFIRQNLDIDRLFGGGIIKLRLVDLDDNVI